MSFSLLRTVASKIIVKGLRISIGWNLGKKNNSSQRFESLTSTPIIGTSPKKNKKKKNNIIEILNKFFWLRDEKKNITNMPRHIYAKCLKKKK